MEFRVDVFVRGQHIVIYKDIWYAVVGEVLVCKGMSALAREPGFNPD